MELLKNVEKLSLLNGLSGDEDDVRAYILEKISPYCNGNVDKLGNITAFKKGNKKTDKKIVFEAHMDETGYMVTSVDDDGHLHFASVGVPLNVTPGKYVRVKATRDGVRYLDGVIGLAPVHLTKKSEMSAVPPLKDMVIDIGAKNKKEALKYVVEGDSVYFNTGFSAVGKLIKGKALDDRVGCACLMDMIMGETEYDAYYVFCVQEEVGLRGSAVAAAALQPDYAIVLEGTTAADIGGTPKHKKVCEVGKGVAVSFADRRTVYKPELVRAVLGIANEAGLAAQLKTFVSGGTDAANWQRKAGAANVLTLSVPVRYLHSRCSLASFDDVLSMRRLAGKLLEKLGGNEIC